MKLLQGPKGPLVIFDYTVSLLAIIGNCLVLESVLKVHFDLTGYRRFLISLAISDLYICGVNLLTFIHATVTLYSTNPHMEKCGADFLRSLQFVGFFANLLNLCGMSVDHYIGIVYPLRYVDLMNKKVTRIAVVAIWVTSFVLGFADFPIATAVYLTNHYESTPAVAPDFSFPGGDTDWSKMLGGLGSPIQDQSYSNTSLTAGLTPEAMSMMKQPLFSKGIDVPAPYGNVPFDAEPTESTPNPFAFLENISGMTPEEIFGPAGYDSNANVIPSNVISDIYSVMANGSVEGTGGSGEENVEKTLYAEILKIVQQKKENVDWCTFYLSNKVWLEFSVMTLTLACFVFLIICYGRIFKEVFANIDPSERNTRKLVVTTFLLLGAFTVCWLPFMMFEFSMIIVLRSDSDSNNARTLAGSAGFLIIHNIFNSLLMCYPLLDPIIYAARMRIVRRYILSQYGRFFPCCRSYIRRIAARRPSVFTYTLTSGQFNSSLHSKSGSTASSNGNGLLNNSRIGLLSTDYPRQYSVSESAFTKRESVSAVSNISTAFAYESPERDEQPDYIISPSAMATVNSSPIRQPTTANGLSSASKPPTAHSVVKLQVVEKSPRQLEDQNELPVSQYPPLIYRRGNSFKRQVRQMYANQHKESSPSHQQEVELSPGRLCKTDHQTPVKNFNKSTTDGGGSVSDDSESKYASNFKRPKTKSRSSYLIPLSLVHPSCCEQEVTPSTSTASAGVSSATSSAPSYSPDDSSAQLLHDHDADGEESEVDESTPKRLLLRPQACPCSEFANSQQVVDKFRDNSLRLLGAGTLGPDHTGACYSTPPQHQRGRTSNCGHEVPDSETKPPIVRMMGKSPTVGDFACPEDDLLPPTAAKRFV